MDRRIVTGSSGEYVGWFDYDKSTILAQKAAGSPYCYYTDIILTASGNLIVEESSNIEGSDITYQEAEPAKAIPVILAAGTDEGVVWLEVEGAKYLKETEL